MEREITRNERPAAASRSGGPAASLPPDPTEIGPYRVTGQVGSGGMGVVLEGVHRETGVEAAIKTVRMIDSALLAGLRREVRALSRLRHPGIVRILEEGLDDALPWYAMELLEGDTLRTLIRDAAPAVTPTDVDPRDPTPGGSEGAGSDLGAPTVDSRPSARRARRRAPRRPRKPARRPPTRSRRDAMLGQIPRLCDALAFLHGEGVVHLDLKPDNVFVTSERPVLMDFGLAARGVAVHGREDLDVVARGLGTLPYIAPEQLSGEAIDARADLYALGCILYEIVTGEPPFVAERPAAVIYAHLEIPPAPPSERAADVPAELEALVLGLLAKAPEDRIGYAADVARTLREMLPEAAEPEAARPPRSYLYRPPLVSREGPFGALRAELARAQRGATRVVLLGGESGVGKTRLAAEVARREGEGFTILTGECASIGMDEAHGAPLAPLHEVFHAIADRVREGSAPALERLLERRGPVLAAFAPALADVPGAEHWEAPAPIPARAARARVVQAAVEAIRTLAELAPLILIVDDAHWADDLTMEVLRTLSGATEASRVPLLVIATYRSDEVGVGLDELLHTGAVTTVRLDRLDPDGARQMVDGMLGRAELPGAMVEQVSNHAEGNPFFIAEYLRAAVREGVLERVEGRWTASDPDGERVAALPLPRSIRELVRRRLERLGPLAREVAEIASVMGRELDPDQLARHVDAERDAIVDAVLELVATRMHEAMPDGRLRFVHGKLHEAVYDALGEARRTALHRSVARSIEAAPARPGRHALLAHHLVAAGEHAPALDALEAAALEALGYGSHGAAETFLERAAELADAHGLEVSVLRRARWERARGDARFALADLGAAARHGRAALERLGHRLPDGALGATLAVLREGAASALERPRDEAEAEALLEASLAALRVAEAGYYQLDAVALLGGSVLATTLAGRAGTEARAAKAYAMLGVVLAAMGMRGRSEALCDRAIGYAEQGGEPATLAFTLYAKSTADVSYCEMERGRTLAQRATELARAVGDEFDAGVGETLLGHVEYWTGELDAAAERYGRLAETSRSVRATQHEAWGLYAQARSLVHTGDCERAVELCRAAKAKLAGQHDAASELICEALLAWALLGTGARGPARDAARSASDRIARSKGAIWPNLPGYAATIEVWLALGGDDPEPMDAARAAHRAMAGLVRGAPLAQSTARLYEGRIALARGDRRRAIRALAEAARVAEERGLALDEGMARRALGDALEGDAARSERAAGLRILETIGARRHLDDGGALA